MVTPPRHQESKTHEQPAPSMVTQRNQTPTQGLEKALLKSMLYPHPWAGVGGHKAHPGPVLRLPPGGVPQNDPPLRKDDSNY